MLSLVIDDERTFKVDPMDGSFIYARNSEDGIQILRTISIDELWLDHDLGGDDTIIAVVDYLCEEAYNGNPVPLDVIWVHSMNPVGAQNVIRSLEKYYEFVHRTRLPECV